MSAGRNAFFDNLFNRDLMRKMFPHQDIALRAYFDEIGKLPPLLSAEQERTLLERAIQKKNVFARDQLVAANLRMVIVIAARFQGNGLPLMDLIQEGNLGLLDAIRDFTLTRQNRFATYAKFKVVRRIENALMANHQMTTSINAAQRMQSMEKVVEAFLARGIEPTPEQIAKKLGIPREQVVEFLVLMQSPLSLDIRYGAEDDPLSELVAGPATILTNEYASVMQELYPQVRDVLTAIEQHVLDLRLGLMDGIFHDHEEIARNFPLPGGRRAVGEERIRQIERQAVEKLKGAFKKHLKKGVNDIMRSDLF